MTVAAPTSAQATAAFPGYRDAETVAWVQRTLLLKGYPDGGRIDGIIGDQIKDEILAFRQRNNLPLIPVIDDQLLDALQTAPNKQASPSQMEATPEKLAQKVAVVAEAKEVRGTTFWLKLMAFITGIGSTIVSILNLLLDHLDEAGNIINPVRTMFADLPIPVWGWFLIMALVALVIGLQAWHVEKKADNVVEAAVEGYREGTIKNDLPPKTEQIAPPAGTGV